MAYESCHGPDNVDNTDNGHGDDNNNNKNNYTPVCLQLLYSDS